MELSESAEGSVFIEVPLSRCNLNRGLILLSSCLFFASCLLLVCRDGLLSIGPRGVVWELADRDLSTLTDSATPTTTTFKGLGDGFEVIEEVVEEVFGELGNGDLAAFVDGDLTVLELGDFAAFLDGDFVTFIVGVLDALEKVDFDALVDGVFDVFVDEGFDVFVDGDFETLVDCLVAGDGGFIFVEGADGVLRGADCKVIVKGDFADDGLVDLLVDLLVDVLDVWSFAFEEANGLGDGEVFGLTVTRDEVGFSLSRCFCAGDGSAHSLVEPVSTLLSTLVRCEGSSSTLESQGVTGFGFSIASSCDSVSRCSSDSSSGSWGVPSTSSTVEPPTNDSLFGVDSSKSDSALGKESVGDF